MTPGNAATGECDSEDRTIGTVTSLLDALTEKQREVLDLLIQHKTSKEISRLLGISPHTVDQRIMLARAKLNVASRGEVAQEYRRLLAARDGQLPAQPIYEQSIYHSSDVAPALPLRHEPMRDDAAMGWSAPGQAVRHEQSMTSGGQALAEPYYRVLPEMFDGPYGTLVRLGAIAFITMFLILIVLGGLTMYSQLSQVVDR